MPLSKLIMKLTGECVSHTAIRNGDFVYQSSFAGVEQVRASKFLAEYNVKYSLRPSDDHLTEDLVERLIERVVDLRGSPYDFPGLIYLGLRYAFFKNTTKKNLWQLSGMYLCTELVEDIIDIKTDSMITPYKLYLKLKESGRWMDSKII